MPAKGDFKPLYERYRIDESGCWIWTGAITGAGYGECKVNSKPVYAHRYFYEFYHSTRIPPGMHLDHLCERKRCVNPRHLEIVTPKENFLRCGYNPSTINSKKTECSQGHPYTGDNLHIAPDGRRKCRTCNRLRVSAYKTRMYNEYYTNYNALLDKDS